MKPKFKNLKEFKDKIDLVIEKNKKLTPRKFRVLVGVTNSDLNNWRTRTGKVEFYEEYMHAQDKILADLEWRAVFDTNTKSAQAWNVLKVYDRNKYDDNFAIIDKVEANQIQLQFNTNKSKLQIGGNRDAKKD